MDDRVPVTVVTGYLGAGKTTLVNRILAGADGKRFAVIVNEFGEIGIDGALIETVGEDLIELNSGCVCCVVRGDLIRTLRGLLKRGPELDGIVIETTGVANPGPVIQTLAADQVLAGLARLDAVVTVVDAVNLPARLDDSPDAADQVALASVLVVNKVSDGGDVTALRARLRALNPHAPILTADRGDVPLDAILATGGFDLDRVPTDLDAHDGHDHDDHDHVTANGISSLSLTCDAPLDPASIEAWIGDLIAVHGTEILRMKGVLSLAGEDRRVIVQSVNSLYEGDYGAPWGDEARWSRIVFIGRHLDPQALRAGFDACRLTETA